MTKSVCFAVYFISLDDFWIPLGWNRLTNQAKKKTPSILFIYFGSGRIDDSAMR